VRGLPGAKCSMPPRPPKPPQTSPSCTRRPPCPPCLPLCPQGKSALVQHFQNSSLLHEDKRCRPVLFHTDGDLAGEPEGFPAGAAPPGAAPP
jgi:hypothetical protein